MIIPGFLGCNTLSNAKACSSLIATEEHFLKIFEKPMLKQHFPQVSSHREEVPIEAVKEHMRDEGIEMR
jgi:hypothetical protein